MARKKVIEEVVQEEIIKDEVVKEDPVIITMGIYKNSTGWRFIKLTTKGDTIISREETDHDTLRSYVFDEFKVQSVKSYLAEVI